MKLALIKEIETEMRSAKLSVNRTLWQWQISRIIAKIGMRWR